MRRSVIFFVFITFILSLIPGCATYPDYGRVEIEDENVRMSVEFSDHDRNLIRKYYKKKHKKMPPGLAKKKKLPPGLQKQLARKGKLPPGLQGRYLPGDLERRLPRLPGGYVRQRIGDDIVIIEVMTRIIVDIIYRAGY